MTFGYNGIGGALCTKGMLVAMGMVAIPLSFHFRGAEGSEPIESKIPTPRSDPRVTRLNRFLSKLDCPIAGMAGDFVRAADENHLDWRLLPSIALIESSGGKAYKNNNIFGWRGGEQRFVTIRSGLELVAYKLGHGALYRRESSFGKLRIYNEDEEYPGLVMAVMNRISPVVRLRNVSYTPQSSMLPNNFAVVRY